MYAFSTNSGLTSINIPDSVISIGTNAFNSCTGLTRVDITDLEAWCKISFNNEQSNPIGYAHHLYLNGEEITNLIIPDTITQVKQYAFNNCKGLISIIIPNSITSINNNAFYGCTSLTEMIVLPTTPPTLSSTGAISSATTTIYIPAGTLSAYQTATNWSNFADKFVELNENGSKPE